MPSWECNIPVKIAEPLRRLTDKGVHFEWREDHEETLNKLRRLMTEVPVL